MASRPSGLPIPLLSTTPPPPAPARPNPAGEMPSRMAVYSTATKTWKDLRSFPEGWGFWSWATDSNSLYMALLLGKATDGVYRMTIPRGEWEKLTDLEGINPPNSVETFVSLTREGQPEVMSRIGAAQIYLLHWPQ